MTNAPREAPEYHTRLLKCSIEVQHSHACWQHAKTLDRPDIAEAAFSGYWFGARSLPRVEVLLANFCDRFDAFPPALQILHRWKSIDPGTRRVICHWHLQLADRLYREFTGEWLVERRAANRHQVSRDLVVRWIEEQAPGRWQPATRIQFARKLLYSATEAQLLRGTRDPRELHRPRVNDDALSYILYLLRGTQIRGTLLENPYLASVGLSETDLERRLQTLPSLQGDLFDLGWKYEGMMDWAAATILNQEHHLKGTA